MRFLGNKGEFSSIFARNDESEETTEVGYDVAFAFRSLIGARFFIHPDEVAKAVERLRLLNPGWQCALSKSIDEWMDVGLPIYARTGPKLNQDFTWSTLPLGPQGDTLYPFRPHRFAFLPRMAMAAYLGLIQPDKVQGVIDGWISAVQREDNPYCYGTNLVVIQRLLSTAWAWLFLAARPPSRTPDGLGLERTLLQILWADAQFLGPRLGDSVPNNHLLVDRFAEFFLGTVLPEFRHPANEYTEEHFRDELLSQTYEDGGGVEHSTHYHEFACEMGVAYLLLSGKHGDAPGDDVRTRIERLLMFQMCLTGPEATHISIGNATEDTLFPLDDDASWCSGSLREFYRALFDPECAPAPAYDSTRERAFWMLGGRLEQAEKCNERDLVPASMPNAGFHVFPDRVTGGRLVFRSGPAEGMRVVAGHMHSDLLSVHFTKEHHSVLVDAGTYTYRHNPKNAAKGAPLWRSYLAGPAAHNTLTIPDVDPLGRIAGDFRNFDTKLRVQSRTHFGNELAWSEARMLDADVYTDYVRGCVHVMGRYWVVYDKVPESSGDGRRPWFGFQFAPGICLTPDDGIVTATSPNGDRLIVLLSTLLDAPQLLEGHLDPLGGWVSKRYGEISPAPQLRYRAEPGQIPSAFVISDAAEVTPKSVQVTPLGEGLLGICVTTQIGQDWLIMGDLSGPQPSVDSGDLFFDGALLWLNFEASELKQLRWIQGGSVRWPSRGVDFELTTAVGAWTAP